MVKFFESIQSKIVNVNQLMPKLRGTVVFTNGCFDILHKGHVSYLARARDLGDMLVLGLNSDSSVQSLKGPGRPVHSEMDRAFVLGALACIDYIVIFSESTPERLLSEIKPHIHVKGGDYTPENLPEKKVINSYGGTIKILPFVDGYSTTNIINKIKD